MCGHFENMDKSNKTTQKFGNVVKLNRRTQTIATAKWAWRGRSTWTQKPKQLEMRLK